MNINSIYRLALYVPLMLFMSAAGATDKGGILVKAGTRYMNLSPDVATLQDMTGNLTIERVCRDSFSGRFRRNDESGLNFGLTDDPVWIRIQLYNPGPAMTRVLEFYNPRIAGVQFFEEDPEGGWRVRQQGTDYPLINREYPCPDPAFLVQLPGESSVTCYVQIRYHGALRFAMRLWEENTFKKHVRDWTFITFILHGMVLAVSLYTLFIFIGIRERSYFYASMLMLSFVLTGMAGGGSGFMYLWPDTPWWSDRSITILGAMAFFWGCLFTNSLLDYRQHGLLTGRLLFLCACGWLILAVLGTTDMPLRFYFNHFLALVTPLLMLVLGVQAYLKGFQPAKYFLLAWGLLDIAIVAMVPINTNLIPLPPMPDMIVPILFVLASTLWVLALTARIRIKEKEAREHLEVEVARRTAELREALARVNTLQGLLPICSHCKKIRDNKGYWNEVEKYISKYTDADFSHGLCPDCLERLYPEIHERLKNEKKLQRTDLLPEGNTL